MKNTSCNIRTRLYEQEMFPNSGAIELYLNWDTWDFEGCEYDCYFFGNRSRVVMQKRTAVSREIFVPIIIREYTLKMGEAYSSQKSVIVCLFTCRHITRKAAIFIHKFNTNGKSDNGLWQSKWKEIHGHHMLLQLCV